MAGRRTRTRRAIHVSKALIDQSTSGLLRKNLVEVYAQVRLCTIRIATKVTTDQATSGSLALRKSIIGLIRRTRNDLDFGSNLSYPKVPDFSKIGRYQVREVRE